MKIAYFPTCRVISSFNLQIRYITMDYTRLHIKTCDVKYYIERAFLNFFFATRLFQNNYNNKFQSIAMFT